MDTHTHTYIHLFMSYITAYTDLVLMLVHKSPSSLDVPNADGCTCRELLEPFKAALSSDSEVTN